MYIFGVNNKFISGLKIYNNISYTICKHPYYILNIFIDENSKIYNYTNNLQINVKDLKNFYKEYNIYPIIQIRNLKKSGNGIYLNCVLKEGLLIFEDDVVYHNKKLINNIYENYRYILNKESIINENKLTRIKKIFDNN